MESRAGDQDQQSGKSSHEVTHAGRWCARGPRRMRSRETGQETLQTIIVVAFVLLPVLISILSFGSLVHTSIGAPAAAASGARAAGPPAGFGRPELARVQGNLRGTRIDPSLCRVPPSASVLRRH